MSATKPIDVCKDCGESAEDHHVFTPYVIPATCACDPRDWGSLENIPSVCSAFDKMDKDPLCTNCEHENGCHVATPEASR